jgi:mannose-6-phosphate isomerase
MAIEVAQQRELQKPWGVTDLRPWSDTNHADRSIGEICYERAGHATATPALLLKVLLTSQPLSIQVHPDDAYAQSIGLANGKSEAWYVVSARPGAAIALGLTRSLTQAQLRRAIDDGSIAELMAWRTVVAGDAVVVPSGTIHAIGPGLVIAEIQQRSDATFRLFDHGRNRELHVDHAVAAAHAVPIGAQQRPNHLGNGRTLLASNPHFVFERLELEPDSRWRLDASRETWLLLLNGSVRAGAIDLVKGEAVFAQAERLELRAGDQGVVCLAAYTGRGGPMPLFLQRIEQPWTKDARRQGVDNTPGMPIGAGQ